MQKTKRKKIIANPLKIGPKRNQGCMKKGVTSWFDLKIWGFYLLIFISFHLHSSETKIECSEIIMEKIKSRARAENLTHKMISMWIEYGSFIEYTSQFIVIECAARTAKTASAKKKKKRTTKHDSVNVLWKSICFFLLLLSKIDFVSFKVQWNAWFSL